MNLVENGLLFISYTTKRKATKNDPDKCFYLPALPLAREAKSPTIQRTTKTTNVVRMLVRNSAELWSEIGLFPINN